MDNKVLTGLKRKLTTCLAGRQEIRFAILFGSVLEGGAFRDLDVAVFVDRARVPAEADLDYAFSLADELAAAISHPADVIILNDAPLAFRYNVSRGTPLLIQDEDAFYTFLERSWDEYLDFEPVAMAYLREMV